MFINIFAQKIKLHSRSRFLTLAVCTLLLVIVGMAQADSALRERKPVDLIVIIDNSCSMFPVDISLPQCFDDRGSDSDFLRITGADLFIARLGFSEGNAENYQVGVVSFGKTAELVSPLQPVDAARDDLAAAIASPTASGGTNIVAALQLAYDELEFSGRARSENQPAIVLITDGVPFPRETQPNTQIQELLESHPDVPLFTMMLGGTRPDDTDYKEYIGFWNNVSNRNTHIHTYEVANASEIETTYNQIVALLQNTITSDGIDVAPEKPLEIYVNPFVRKIIVTVIHTDGSKGRLQIIDPDGNEVVASESGVSQFRGDVNPVEVISISEPRLSDDLRDAVWTITSDQPVTVFLDVENAYDIDVVSPTVAITSATGEFLATSTHSAKMPLPVQLRLVSEGDVILDPQPIYGTVVSPTGEIADLKIDKTLIPRDGIYEFNVDFADLFTDVFENSGRYTLLLNAGEAEFTAAVTRPIASSRLYVDIGRVPVFTSVEPSVFSCASAEIEALTVSLTDMEVVQLGSASIRAISPSLDSVALFAQADDDPNKYQLQMVNVCDELASSVTCDGSNSQPLTIHFSGLNNETGLPISVDQEIDVEVTGKACPTSTPLPTATPTPTPIPDSDGDTFVDPVDACVDEAGIARFDGCPVPLSWWIGGGVAAIALLAFLVFFLIPFLRVQFGPVPTGYLLIRDSKNPADSKMKSLATTAKNKRVVKIKIGGDKRRDHIYKNGLEPSEFIAYRRSDGTTLVENTKKSRSATPLNDKRKNTISTSNSSIKIEVSSDRDRLR